MNAQWFITYDFGWFAHFSADRDRGQNNFSVTCSIRYRKKCERILVSDVNRPSNYTRYSPGPWFKPTRVYCDQPTAHSELLLIYEAMAQESRLGVPGVELCVSRSARRPDVGNSSTSCKKMLHLMNVTEQYHGTVGAPILIKLSTGTRGAYSCSIRSSS